MNRKIKFTIMLLFAFSIFVIPTYAKPEASDQSFFIVLPNRHYGIAVNVVFNGKYDSLLLRVEVEQIEPQYEYIEEGISERAGIIFTEPIYGHEAEPNTLCAVRVRVFHNNVMVYYGFVLTQINEYGTVSSPIRGDLAPYPI